MRHDTLGSSLGLVWVLVLALVGAAGCKKEEKSSSTGDGDKEAMGAMSASQEEEADKPIDWPKEKRNVYQGTADGIAFTVEIPEPRLAIEVKKGDDTLPGYVTWNAKGNFLDAPGFTVRPLPAQLYPSSPEDLKTRGIMNPAQKVTLAEALPGGGFLQVTEEPSKHYLSVKVYRKNAAGKAVTFEISERRSKGIPSFEGEKAWAIAVAKSLTLP